MLPAQKLLQALHYTFTCLLQVHFFLYATSAETTASTPLHFFLSYIKQSCALNAVHVLSTAPSYSKIGSAEIQLPLHVQAAYVKKKRFSTACFQAVQFPGREEGAGREGGRYKEEEVVGNASDDNMRCRAAMPTSIRRVGQATRQRRCPDCDNSLHAWQGTQTSKLYNVHLSGMYGPLLR